MIAVLSEKLDVDGGYVVAFHYEGMPAHSMHEFTSIDAALAAYPELDWQEPDQDADNDVIKVSYSPA